VSGAGCLLLWRAVLVLLAGSGKGKAAPQAASSDANSNAAPTSTMPQL